MKLLRSAFIGALLLLPQMAVMQTKDAAACAFVPGGCSPAAGRALIDSVFSTIGPILVAFAAGASVLFVVIGGAQMMLNFGDEGAGTKGRKTVLYALGGFGFVLLSQVILTFVHNIASPLQGATTPQIDIMKTIVGVMLSLFNVTAMIVAIYAGMRMLFARGKQEEYQKGVNTLIWAVMGAIVINLAHTLVLTLLAFLS